MLIHGDFHTALTLALVVKSLSAKAGDIQGVDPFPGLGRSLEEGMATRSSVLAWRIPWTEEHGGLHTVHRVAKFWT